MSTENQNAGQSPAVDQNQLIAERRAKLAEWRQSGRAYPNDFARENTGCCGSRTMLAMPLQA